MIYLIKRVVDTAPSNEISVNR